MPVNDNVPFSDTEQGLIRFINSVRPKSGSLVKTLKAVEKWLQHSKLLALVCFFFVVAKVIILDEWHGWFTIYALCGVTMPVLMIDRLEHVLGRWKAHFSFNKRRPVIKWVFERAGE